MAAEDIDLANAVARAIRSVDRDLAFMVMPAMATETAAERSGLRMVREIYCDRAYADSGNLVSRSVAGAVIKDAAAATRNVLAMVADGAIHCLSGKRIPARIDSVCVHGDTPDAVRMAHSLRKGLEDAGLLVKGFADIAAEDSRTA
jgi:UPF0271 protein